ncbi:S8 family serine peptidase [Flavobacteriaceae bacterium S356]|uniref:S8 family serine peptidase n=1 Tax=Asprobacillus argus TaxID=3076534 RepID=A0ABU3LBP8_9FLAO|nr:S8 family serine peptidase [Flavobacteriaceae bacterium S356]
MKSLKQITYLLTGLILVAGCKTVSNLPVPKGNPVAISAVAKKAALTENVKQGWGHLDLLKDSIPGMSLDKAYEFVQNKKGVTVVVAVVDSGTDLEHEDLKDVAWVNPKEIPGNGIDDDKNGFVDDINGWNFLGPIYKENAELYRIIKDSTIVDKATYSKAKMAYDKKIAEASKNKARFGQILQAVNFANDNISEKLGTKKYTKEDLKKIDVSSSQVLSQSVAIANQMFDLGLTSLQEAIDELTDLVSNAEDLLGEKAIKKEYRKVLNNNENSMATKIYGDNKSGHSEKDESHGSHVSGIIGASRNNGKGMNGVAKNVKIMAVRVVPDGDEYDKDVALGIRYAVDNGAKVINTSFGKGYSPKKEWVYEAIQYAEKNDVLIVNAAGNDGKDIDVSVSYPNDTPDMKNEIADNFLTVGAMSANYNEKLPASFTNYGKINVDVFAPGVEIYSTTPENEYAYKNGTSMAAPSAAGVAALVRSYYPQLSASQVKHVLMNSGTKIDLEVVRPGSVSREKPDGEKVNFSELSVSGRVVNAYNALKMADQMVNGK